MVFFTRRKIVLVVPACVEFSFCFRVQTVRAINRQRKVITFFFTKLLRSIHNRVRRALGDNYYYIAYELVVASTNISVTALRHVSNGVYIHICARSRGRSSHPRSFREKDIVGANGSTRF